MAKDINIKVKTEGVDQAAAQIGGVTESIQQMTAAQRESFEASQLAEEGSLGLSAAIEKGSQDQAEFADYLRQSSQDAQDFQEYMDQAAASAENAGEAVGDAGRASETGFEKAASTANVFDRIVNNVTSSALRMITGFLGVNAVIRLIETLNKRLEEMEKKQDEIAGKALKSGEIGQALEAATGTVGKQGDWAQKALSLQMSGGLESETTSALMLGMQGATAGVGGIQNPLVAAMLQRLAPKLGASGKSGGDLNAIFEAAAKEGIGPAGLESFITKQLGISDAQSLAYLSSPLGKSRSELGSEGIADVAAAKPSEDWARRLKNAQAELDRRTATGRDKWYLGDNAEKKQIALEQLVSDLESAKGTAPESKQTEYDEIISRVQELPLNIAAGKDMDDPKSQQHTLKRAVDLVNKPVSMNFDYSHNTIIQPITGRDPFRDGRASPEQVAP